MEFVRLGLFALLITFRSYLAVSLLLCPFLRYAVRIRFSGKRDCSCRTGSLWSTDVPSDVLKEMIIIDGNCLYLYEARMNENRNKIQSGTVLLILILFRKKVNFFYKVREEI